MKPNILVITNNYPYGSGEEFFETEIDYLSKNFNKIVIISNSTTSNVTKHIPSNVKVYRYIQKYNSLLSAKYVLCSKFRNEIDVIKKTYKMKLNFHIIKNILATMVKGYYFEKYINYCIKTENLNNNNLIIYSYWCNFFTYAAIEYKKRHPNIKVVTRMHRYDLYFESSDINYLPLRKYIIDNINKVFFISDNGLNYIKNKIPSINKTKLTVSRLGILNSGNFALPSDDGIFRLVSCSFVSSVKRIDLIIKSLADIDNSIQVEWIHFGNGIDFDEITLLAQKMLSGKKNIKYKFHGYIENKNLFDFYKAHKIDAFINVSSSEGIPVTIMEALSFHIPVIATNVGGTSEIVNNADGILLSSNPVPNQIINAILKIKNLDNNDISILRNNAYKMWLDNYNADKNYNNFVSYLLNEILK